MNKYLTILLVLVFWGCHKNEKYENFKNIRLDKYLINEKQVSKTIRQLVDSNNSDQALKLIDTLIYFNRQNGYLYFERGFVEGYNFHHEKAIKDFKIAKDLHYNKTECLFFIKVSQQALDMKRKINSDPTLRKF